MANGEWRMANGNSEQRTEMQTGDGGRETGDGGGTKNAGEEQEQYETEKVRQSESRHSVRNFTCSAFDVFVAFAAFRSAEEESKGKKAFPQP